MLTRQNIQNAKQGLIVCLKNIYLEEVIYRILPRGAEYYCAEPNISTQSGIHKAMHTPWTK
jgi:hypothetical protein